MLYSNNFRKVALPALAVAMLLASTGTALASDTPTPAASPSAATGDNHGANHLPGVSLGKPAISAADLQALKDKFAAAKQAYLDAQVALKTADLNLATLRDKYMADYKAAMATALQDAKTAAGVGTVDPKIQAARDLVKSTYLALNDARSKVSAAEKASKASPTDAALLSALNDARTAATAALNAFNSAKQALLALGGNTDKQSGDKKIDTKAVSEAGTKAFLAAHPDFATAQQALMDARKAVEVARKALSDAGATLNSATKGHNGDAGKGGLETHKSPTGVTGPTGPTGSDSPAPLPSPTQK